jgi:peroxiredoxin
MKMKWSIAFAIVLALSAFTPLQNENKGYQTGDEVADFSLKNVNGKMVSMSNFKTAKGFIVVFTCNHCPFSQAYESRIIDLHKRYQAKGWPVIAINPNDPVREPEDSYANMQKRALEKKYPFPYLLDDTQEVARRFGATRTPHVFLLKKSDKKLVLHYIGAVDDNSEEPEQVQQRYVETAIAELEAGTAVTRQVTKAIGCGIKWKKQ